MNHFLPVLLELLGFGVTLIFVIPVTRIILASIKRNTSVRANFMCRLFSFSIETTRPANSLPLHKP